MGRPQLTVTLTVDEAHALTVDVLTAAGTSPANASIMADSVVAAELDGIHSHGLFRLPTYADHTSIGKVDGKAVPKVAQVAAAALSVDAMNGFAHPAIAAGLGRLVPLTREAAAAAMGVTRSYNCSIVGYHVERLATEGLVGFAFVNSPASMAPWGGVERVFGTNPLAFACPRPDGRPPMVIDQASSKVARSDILVAAKEGRPVPEGWALDTEGNPTTDAEAAVAGTVLPYGDHKGAAIALMVEIMAAGLTGANFSRQAPPFVTNEGGPPGTGQFFIALDPAAFGGADALGRIEALFQAILAQEGTRLPGDKRHAARARIRAEGIAIDPALHDDLIRRSRV